MEETKIFTSQNYWPIDTKEVEKRYNAKYLGDFSIKLRNQWTKKPRAIFYQYDPDFSKGHTNYFSMFCYIDKLTKKTGIMIGKGDSVTELPWYGVKADNGDIIVPTYKRHYITSNDKSVFASGNGQFMRTNRADRLVLIKIAEDKFFINP